MTGKTLERVAAVARATAGFRVAIFLDGASLTDMEQAVRAGSVEGYTTNPTLAAKAGVRDYREFALQALDRIGDAPISFEVVGDELDEMAAQAREIASWGPNVYVKVPICNTRGESTIPIVRELSSDRLNLNVTAIMTLDQVRAVSTAIAPDAPAYVSIFAGRIADTGIDPCPVMREAVRICESQPNLGVLWASPREVLNIYQADECGVHVIVATADLIAKLHLRGKNLEEFSRETVQMFYDDAVRAGYHL